MRKWAEDLKRHFSKEDIYMVNKYMKRCSTLLSLKEMQVKTTMRYHHRMVVKIAIIKKSANNKFQRRCGKKGILFHYPWKCILVQPLWRTVILKKLGIKLQMTQPTHYWAYTLKP